MRRAGRSSVRAGGRPAVPWYGKTARSVHEPSPTVYAPPRGSTIGSHSTVAPAPDAAITAPPLVRGDHRLEERAALQHRAQVQRRAVGEVDEPGHAHRSDVRVGVLGVARGSAPGRRADRRAQAARSTRRPARSTRSGCSNAAAVGSTSTSSPPLRARRSASNVARRSAPLAAADQRDRAGGLGHAGSCARGAYWRGPTAPDCGRAKLPAGNLPAFRDRGDG